VNGKGHGVLLSLLALFSVRADPLMFMAGWDWARCQMRLAVMGGWDKMKEWKRECC